jgi:two-component system cell cycle response regulator DivK
MPAKILIIEDDLASRELANYLLTAAGYITLTASDGGTGARLAVSEGPDLILCDLHLPVMDGYEVVAYLKEHAAWRRVPLIALTASSMVGDREKTLAAGFNDYLSKPITPETFIDEVSAFLPQELRTSSPIGGKRQG